MTNPTRSHHDVIIIGARAAGASVAMLLARRGIDVVCIDRSVEGSDTLSTHALVRPGVDLLRSWGLMDAVEAAGTPAIERVGYHYGVGAQARSIDFALDRSARLTAPRRTVLDPILIDAARSAGAQFRFETRLVDIITVGDLVTGVRVAGPAGEQTLTAQVIVGADGAGSLLARLVGAPYTFTGEHASASVFAYFGEWDDPSYDTYLTTDAIVGSIATNDAAVCVFICVPQDRFNLNIRTDIAAGFWDVVDDVTPELAGELRSRPLLGRLRSFPGHFGFTRKAGGPGWLLIGDAGAFADPVTAHGMTSAFRDAAAASQLIAERLSGRPEAECWADFAQQRDSVAHRLISAVDDIVAYRNPLDDVQSAHKTMSRVFRDEAQMIQAGFSTLALAS